MASVGPKDRRWDTWLTTALPDRSGGGNTVLDVDRRLRSRANTPSEQGVRVDARTLRQGALWLTVAGLALMVAIWVGQSLAHLAFILLVAWLIAVASEPAISRLEATGLRRGGAVALVACVAGGIVALFAVGLGATLATQVDELAASAPSALDTASSWVRQISGGSIDLKSVAGERVNALAASPSVALELIGSVLDSILTAATIAVFAIYLAAGGPKLQRKVASWLPKRRQEVLLDVWSISVSKAGGFVISKVALAAISSVAHVGAFYVIGVPYWLPMGLFAGIVSQFIPVIGTYIGAALPAAVALENSGWTAIWVLAFAVVYQQIENYVIHPRLAGTTMNLNGGVALAAVIAGLALFGPIGALIGMPLAAIIEALIETYAHRYELHPELIEQEQAAKKRRKR